MWFQSNGTVWLLTFDKATWKKHYFLWLPRARILSLSVLPSVSFGATFEFLSLSQTLSLSPSVFLSVSFRLVLLPSQFHFILLSLPLCHESFSHSQTFSLFNWGELLNLNVTTITISSGISLPRPPKCWLRTAISRFVSFFCQFSM